MKNVPHDPSLQQYSLLMTAPAAIAIIEGPEHTFKLINDNYKKLVGTGRDLIGRSVRDVFPELKGQGFYELLDAVYSTQEPFIGKETSIKLVDAKSGSVQDMFIDFVYQPIVDEDGKSTGIFVHATDVTEAVQNRIQIDEARNRYKIVLGSVDEGFCIIEMIFDEHGTPNDYRFIETNANFEEQTGLVDVIGKTTKEVVPGLEQHWYDLYGDVAKSGKPTQFSQGSDAMGRWFDVQATKVGSLDQPWVALLFRDITESKKAERELREQIGLVEALMNNTIGCLCVIDDGGLITYMNPAAIDTTGYSLAESIGRSIHELMHYQHPDGTSYPEKDCPMYAAYTNGKRLPETETTFYRKNGHQFPVRITSTPIDGERGLGNVVEFRDISEFKKSQSELQRTKDRYDALFNSNTVALATATMQGRVLEANQNFLKMFGLTKTDLIKGFSSKDVTAPSDINASKMFEAIQTKGESLPIERRYKRKNGEEFPALVGSVRLPGDTSTFVSFIIDTSENEQLKELNKTKDEFIALASHQLRTPATAVKQYLGVVMEEYAGPITPDQLQYLNIANNANERQLMLIEDLLKTARIDARGFGLILRPHDITHIITDAIAQYKPAVQAKNQRIAFKGGDQKILVPLDVTEMTVCIANLIENASKYSPSGSLIEINLSETNSIVQLCIKDQGVGIEKKNLDRIFEKFTRIHNELSDTVSGSGLGLYWVKRIIDIHNGSLTIDSKLGEGTTFIMQLKK